MSESSGKNFPIRILITMGDPAGVGPEVICKALTHNDLSRSASYAIVGLCEVLDTAAGRLGRNIEFRRVETVESLFSCQASGFVPLFEPEGLAPLQFQLGKAQAVCGEAAFRCIVSSIQAAKQGACDAVVTAPISKQALHMAGHNYPGHTEIFTQLTGAASSALMLMAGRFRVAHVTSHVSMRGAISQITKQRVLEVISLMDDALTRIDGKPPRIAVAALNPHAGETGLFGQEEIEQIEPAVRQARSLGINAEGPLPADSLFPQLLGGRFDGVVAMYHDQGHIAFKIHNFRYHPDSREWEEIRGVNVTLGLPIVRTSVDHGTAFDLAGTGKACERSLLDAIDAACMLATGKTKSAHTCLR